MLFLSVTTSLEIISAGSILKWVLATTLRGPPPSPDGSYGLRPSARTKGSILNTGLGFSHIECCVTKQREGATPSPDEASGLFCYVPLHKIWYDIHGSICSITFSPNNHRTTSLRKKRYGRRY